MSVFKGGPDGDESRFVRESMVRRFEAAFGSSTGGVYVASAPGRANLIGEHTDYQDGLVMPFALDKGVYVAFRLRADDEVNVFAEDLNSNGSMRLSRLREKRAADASVGPCIEPKWLRYVMGPFDWLEFEDGSRCARGCDALIASNVPLGGGVSSSSALTVAFALVARTCNGAKALKKRRDGKSAFLMATCEAEWHFSGLGGGMMDQTASLFGKEECVFAIDCRKGELSDLDDGGGDPYVTADGAAFVVLNTMVAHSLPDSPYAKRRQSCERVAAAMAAKWPDRRVTHLRDASDLGDAEATRMVDVRATKGCFNGTSTRVFLAIR